MLVSQKCMDSSDVCHELFSYYYKLSQNLSSGLHHVELLETHQCSSVLKGWAKQPTNAKKPQGSKVRKRSTGERVRKKKKKKKCGGEEVRVVIEGLQKGCRTKPE